MAGFGGAVKLTGESAYRKALQNITQTLREVDSELKVVASQYAKNDMSQEALEARSEALTKKLKTQAERVQILTERYQTLETEAQDNTNRHKALKDELDKAAQELKEIEAESGKTSQEYQTQSDYLAALTKEYQRSETEINKQETALSKARTELNNAKAAMNTTESELGELSAALQNAASKEENLGDSADGAASDLRDLENRADSAGRETNDLGNSADDAAQQMRDAANGGFTVFKGMLADLASNIIQSVISGLQSLASEAMAASDALDKFETTMSFAGFDDATIQQARQSVQAYADSTVYELNTVANTSAQLAANGIEDFQGLTEAAGNLNAVAGGSAETFNSVAMVLTQTAGAGKLTTENWNQLANAIPGASGVLIQALQDAGAYTGDFRTAMSEGQITAEEFNAAIMQLGSDPVAVEAAQSVTTFEGAVGNMKANVVAGFLEIYDTIGKENITQLITDVGDFVNDVIPPLVSAVAWFVQNLPVIAPMISAIAGAMVGIMVAQKINALVTAFTAWRAATEGMTIAQALLNAVMNANPIVLILSLIGMLVGALVALWATNDDFREAVLSAWEAIKAGFSAAWDGIKTFFSETLPEIFNNVVENVRSWVNNVVNFISELPGRVWTFLTNLITKIITWRIEMEAKALEAARNFVSNIVTKIQELPGKVWTFLSNVVSKVVTFATNFKNKAREAAIGAFNAIKDKIAELPGEVLEIGHNIVEGLWNGINDMTSWVIGKIQGFGENVLSGIRNFFGINSPSKLFEDEVGKYLAEGIGVGFTDEMRNVTADMQDALPTSFNVGTDVNSSGLSSTGGLDYYNLVNAFKEALGDMTVELDDVTVGKFVKKTVTDVIYT